MVKQITGFKSLSMEMAFRESGLEQMTIAQINEVVGKFCDIYYEQAQEGYDFKEVLFEIGQRRAEKKPMSRETFEAKHKPEEVLP